jgi:hypothetical protein
MVKIRKIGIRILGLIVLGVFFQTCEKVTLEKVKVEGTVKFSTDVLPIFSNCTGCHGGSQKPDLRSDKAYASLTSGGYYNLTTPEESKIYKKLYTSPHTTRASEIEKQKILLWIQQGAKND